MNENRTLANRLDEENLLVPSARPLSGAGATGERPGTSLLTIIWRRRWVFLGCILLSLAGGIVYLSRCTPLYSSSAQIYAQQGAPKLLADLLTTSAGSMNYLFTQCDLIRSTAVPST